MQTLVIQSNNIEKLEALKQFLTAFKIDFSIEDKPYNPEFVAKIERGRKGILEGRGKKITLDDIWK
jgi:hypothetical protein